MNHLLILLITFLLFVSCDRKKENNESKPEILISDHDFDKFIIAPHSIGPVKIGMTMHEAEHQLRSFERRRFSSNDLGFDGASPAVIYCYNNEPILAAISSMYSDTVTFLVAYHQKLKTANGLHPKMTIKDLLISYPDLKIHMDQKNGWEVADDTINNWSFISVTDKKTMIGEYKDSETSKPKNLMTKVDWITIQ